MQSYFKKETVTIYVYINADFTGAPVGLIKTYKRVPLLILYSSHVDVISIWFIIVNLPFQDTELSTRTLSVFTLWSAISCKHSVQRICNDMPWNEDVRNIRVCILFPKKMVIFWFTELWIRRDKWFLSTYLRVLIIMYDVGYFQKYNLTVSVPMVAM